MVSTTRYMYLQSIFNPSCFAELDLLRLPDSKSLQTTILNLIKNGQKVLQKHRKHCGKRRNCSLRAISSFPTLFLKDLFCRHIQNKVLFVKGLNLLFPVFSIDLYCRYIKDMGLSGEGLNLLFPQCLNLLFSESLFKV